MSGRVLPFIYLSRGISSSALSREKAVSKDVFVYHKNKICYSPIEAELPPIRFLNMYDIQRRERAIFIPYFTTGSILKVLWTDKTSVSGLCQFIGICTFKNISFGKVSSVFTLRNVVNNEAANLSFELYSPIIQNIELIRYQRLEWGKTDLKDLEEYPLSASTVPLDLNQILTDKPVILTCWKSRPYLTVNELQDQMDKDDLKILSTPEEVKLLNNPYYKWLKTEYLVNNDPDVSEKFYEISKPTKEDMEQFRRSRNRKVNSVYVEA